MPLELPDGSFDEIAVDLVLYANSAAQAVGAAEVILARVPDAAGLRHQMEELKATAARAGTLYAFFRAAAPYEEQVRDFLAGLGAATGADSKRRAAS